MAQKLNIDYRLLTPSKRLTGNCWSPLERLTGAEVTPEERQRIARGADELDLVNSGLEETMVNAYETIRQTMLATPGVMPRGDASGSRATAGQYPWKPS